MTWDFFERRTSLTIDPSEWEKGQAEFARVGLTDVIKYQALPIDNNLILGPHQSFNATMRSTLQDFFDSDAKTLLHMEDDCQFKDLGHLAAALSELPADWDMVYLGANILEDRPERFSEHLFRVREAWTTHAIGFSRRPIKFILDNQPGFSERMLDNWLGSQLPTLQAFVVAPTVAWQRAHHSGIWGRFADYDEVFRESDRKLDLAQPWIQYIQDVDVDADLDLAIRDLLCQCFGQDTAFRDRRYATEQPAHRWLLRSGDGSLIGHVAAHEKTVSHNDVSMRVLGIAEACIHPNSRRGGKLRQLLSKIDEWAIGQPFQYSVLFGQWVMYASSGYMPALNLWNESGNENYSDVMVKSFGDNTWPHNERVQLLGPRF